jgi:NAD-dependent SIR2 family protein deacetylase
MIKDKKYAIFIGAGASATEGVPIQSNLFNDYFKLLKKV